MQQLDSSIQFRIFSYLSIGQYFELALLGRHFRELIKENVLEFAISHQVIYKTQSLIASIIHFEPNRKGIWVCKSILSQFQTQEFSQLRFELGLMALKEFSRCKMALEYSTTRRDKYYRIMTDLIASGNFLACKYLIKNPLGFVKDEKFLHYHQTFVVLDSIHDLLDQNYCPQPNTLQQCYQYYYHLLVEFSRSKLKKTDAQLVVSHFEYDMDHFLSLLNEVDAKSKDYLWLKTHAEYFQLDVEKKMSKQSFEQIEQILLQYPMKVLAHIAWGYYMSNIPNVTRDDEKSLRYYKICAKKGHALSMNNLSTFYKMGICKKRNLAKALDYLHQAAYQGCAQAYLNLAYMYDSGDGVAINHTKALYYYKKAAKFKLSMGLFKVGYYYDVGIGTTPNPKLAFKYYYKAVLLNNVHALNNIALLYETGVGVSQQNLHLALAFYSIAAEKGSAYGYNNLGLMNMLGKGLRRPDFEEAERCFNIAISKGSQQATTNLQLLYKQMEKMGIYKQRFFVTRWMFSWYDLIMNKLSI